MGVVQWKAFFYVIVCFVLDHMLLSLSHTRVLWFWYTKNPVWVYVNADAGMIRMEGSLLCNVSFWARLMSKREWMNSKTYERLKVSHKERQRASREGERKYWMIEIEVEEVHRTKKGNTFELYNKSLTCFGSTQIKTLMLCANWRKHIKYVYD